MGPAVAHPGFATIAAGIGKGRRRGLGFKHLLARRPYNACMGQAQSKRRDVPRYPVWKTASMLHDGREQLCIIEERSPLGARIRINPNLPLPPRFALEVTPGGFAYAKVAWQRDDRAGVKLDLPLQSPGFLRQMWEWLKPESLDAGVGSSRSGSDAPV